MKVSYTGEDVFRRRILRNQLGWLHWLPHAAKWFPILLGAIAIILVILVTWLCACGESFFSLTDRLPAQVLILEGWIGYGGIRAAAAELEQGGYQYILTTGGQPDDRPYSPSYAEIAGQELVQLGISNDKIIIAPTGEIERERTFKSSVAAWRALQTNGIHPEAINVLTLGPHARRTCLVYAKVFAPAAQVGVIAWTPPEYRLEPWWRSKVRTNCFLKEIFGYPFEALLNSGRISNSPSRSEIQKTEGR
jgi:DUF218 domain